MNKWLNINEAPENIPVLVDGGTAILRQGKWYTGMEEPLFQREIQWEVTGWTHIPTINRS